jgi:hypothetical protein
MSLKVFWLEGKMSIKANSKEEADFLGKVIIYLGQIPIPHVRSADHTQAVAQAISKVFDSAWTHHAQAKWACTCFKSWWDTDCDWAKASAMTSDLPANWMAFKKVMCKAKLKYFDECINEIAHTNLRPWDLMDWHEGDLYNDWSAAGLATSDNAKLRAITDSIHQAYNVGLEDVQQVHVFSDSANMLCLTMDVSHHLGQPSSLSICKVLVPWL